MGGTRDKHGEEEKCIQVEGRIHSEDRGVDVKLLTWTWGSRAYTGLVWFRLEKIERPAFAWSNFSRLDVSGVKIFTLHCLANL